MRSDRRAVLICIVVAAISLLIVWTFRHRPAPPPTPKLVQTEGVRAVRMDTQTFRIRWLPVGDMPPAMAKGGDAQPRERASKPVEVVARPLPPGARIVKRAALRQDLCARHGMRKQYYTGRRGWQHWRCRR